MMRAYLFLFIFAVGVSSCKSPEARRPISQKSGSFIKISAERNKKLNTEESLKIEEIIKKDTSKTYYASESGFWYYYNTQVDKDTITPSFGDIVNFDYDVKDINGNEIYSDEDIHPRDYAIDQEEIFTGLREGLKLMKPGETVTFLFLSQKAYGYYGDKNRIGTNTPVICEVTVNSIIQNQND